jgi:hypothetical protein
MLTPEQVDRARNWMYGTAGSHLPDGYQRLRRHMMIGGVDLPWQLTKEHTENEQHLWCLYFDILQEFADAAREEEIQRMREMTEEEIIAQIKLNDARWATLDAMLAAREERKAKLAERLSALHAA